MSVILLDGCEDLSSWVQAANPPTIVAGRNGNAFNMPVVVSNGLAATHYIAAADQTDTLTIGYAKRFSQRDQPHVDFTLRSDNGATSHISFNMNTSGVFHLSRAGTLILTSTAAPLVQNTWYYIEVTVTLSDTVGTAAIKINGVDAGSATGLDTKNGGTKTVFDSIGLHGQVTSSQGVQCDDLYVTNDAVLLGDCRVETLYPNGNGAANAWVGSDADSTDNYQLVDDLPVNTADFVNSSTPTAQDLYTMTDLAAGTGTVRAVCIAANALKTDGGPRQVKLLSRGSSTNASAARDLGTAFVNAHWATTINPETGVAWTRAEVNALQSGVELV